MFRRWNPFSQRCRGATLIEVLAGLVLLGTVLSAMVVARGRFDRQWRAADEKLVAARVSEELLAGWLSAPPGAAPVPGRGKLSDMPDLIWQTSWIPNPAAQRLGVRMARLDVWRRSDAREPLLSIEFLLNPPTPTTQRSAP